MLEVLAVLAVSTAAGLRIALPLLVIALLQADGLWMQLPFLSKVPPPIAVGILASWSFFEVFASKHLTGQRFLQVIELTFSPFVGAILGLAIARSMNSTEWLGLAWILGIIGGLVTLVLQLIQTGFFYQRRRIPVWVLFAQDFLCVILVFLAFDAPRQGGLIALLYLWLTIRISKEWHRWYSEQGNRRSLRNPKRRKKDPD